jgi:hypothetical protein
MKKMLLAATLLSLVGASTVMAGGLATAPVVSRIVAVHAVSVLPAMPAMAKLGAMPTAGSAKLGALPGLANIGNSGALPGLAQSQSAPEVALPYSVCQLTGKCDPWLSYNSKVWPGLMTSWAKSSIYTGSLVFGVSNAAGILLGTTTCAANPDCGGAPLPLLVQGGIAALGALTNGAVGLVIVHPIPPIRFPGEYQA